MGVVSKAVWAVCGIGASGADFAVVAIWVRPDGCCDGVEDDIFGVLVLGF